MWTAIKQFIHGGHKFAVGEIIDGSKVDPKVLAQWEKNEWIRKGQWKRVLKHEGDGTTTEKPWEEIKTSKKSDKE